MHVGRPLAEPPEEGGRQNEGHQCVSCRRDPLADDAHRIRHLPNKRRGHCAEKELLPSTDAREGSARREIKKIRQWGARRHGNQGGANLSKHGPDTGEGNTVCLCATEPQQVRLQALQLAGTKCLRT